MTNLIRLPDAVVADHRHLVHLVMSWEKTNLPLSNV